jgi:hypothetical protein
MLSFYYYILFIFCYLLLTIYYWSRTLELTSEKNLLKLENNLFRAKCIKCFHEENIPQIIFVTPTVFKPEQKADLTRLGQTLSNICNLYWIIVEVLKKFI